MSYFDKWYRFNKFQYILWPDVAPRDGSYFAIQMDYDFEDKQARLTIGYYFNPPTDLLMKTHEERSMKYILHLAPSIATIIIRAIFG